MDNACGRRKCEEVRELIESWLDQQGHDRCWYYPELFEKLAALLNVQCRVAPRLPPRAEFEAGCRRYQDVEFGPLTAGQSAETEPSP